MKGLVLVFVLVVSATAFGGGYYKGSVDGGYITTTNTNIGDDKAPKGYNYKKHYRKARKVHFMNRVFNLNNCKGKSHHSS